MLAVYDETAFVLPKPENGKRLDLFKSRMLTFFASNA
jgi:hypothetical protein